MALAMCACAWPGLAMAKGIARGKGPDRVALAFNGGHRFQYAGYYAAAAKGFYADEGLNVEWVVPQNGGHPLEAVLKGRAEYGVASADIAKARAEGAPVVALAAIFQHSTLGLMSRRDRNLAYLPDYAGKTILAGEDGRAEILAAFAKAGVDPAAIRFAPAGKGVDAVIDGTAEASVGSIASQPVEMRLRGVEPRTIQPIEHGIDFYGETLFTTEEEIDRHPERAEGMRRACLKGWEYALENVDEAIETILAMPGATEGGATRDALRAEAKLVAGAMQSKLVEIGHMNPARWDRIAETYAELGLAPREGKLEGFVHAAPTFGAYGAIAKGIGFLLVAVALMLVVGGYWNHKLRGAVRKKTEELRRSKEAAEENEARFRALHNASFGGIAIHDKGIILDCNRGLTELTGYSFEELIGMDGLLLIAETKRDWVREHIAARYEKPYEAIGLRKNGEEYPLRLEAREIPYRGKRARVVEFRDLTEQKRAEEAQREAEARLTTLSDNYTGGLVYQIAVNPETGVRRFTYVSEGIERLHGLTAEEVLADPAALYSQVIEEDRPLLAASEERALAEMTQFSEEVRLRVGTGEEKWFLFTSTPRRLGDEVVWDGLEVDVTAQKRAEEEKENLQLQLAHAQKLESIGRLAGGVAHDFNNMLAVIQGHTEMALEGVGENEGLRADLEEIRKAAERSANLTRQLLAFARKQTVAPRVVDVNGMVEGMLKMLRRLIGENIELEWKPGADAGAVKVDPTQIDQILVNLCVNARDAVGNGGKIAIGTGKATFDADYCSRHAGAVPGKFAWLAVEDNGKGMNTDVLPHIFEPFFTTKESGQGTGLGLATVYGIVKQNNGFIGVDSAPGEGATFTIYLPRHAGAAAGANEQAAPVESEPGHETILLVEDEPAILNMVKNMLQRRGYRVLAAGTPGDAIQVARTHAGPIDLLVTDVVMPEMNGMDLALALVTIRPGIKRLFMSGHTADILAHRGILDEGVCFIHKPFSVKEMGDKVIEALESGSGQGPAGGKHGRRQA